MSGRQEEERDRQSALAKPEENPIAEVEKKDPFEEIDFGSFFQEYLDPGYRSQSEREDIEKPSFENFLSKQSNLTDHLRWQLGAISVSPQVHDAAEEIIGNLNEDGYLIASDEELLGIKPAAAPDADAEAQAKILGEATALGIDAVVPDEFAPAEASAEYRHGGTGRGIWRNSTGESKRRCIPESQGPAPLRAGKPRRRQARPKFPPQASRVPICTKPWRWSGNSIRRV